MDQDLDQTLDGVGPRLRELRAAAASSPWPTSPADTGISVSTLSRLESGDRRPTLELLLPLARAYGVTLDELVDAPPTGDPRIHIKPIKAHGMTMLPLTRRAGGIQAYKLIIPARSARRQPELKTHEGYEWLYVLDGTLRAIIGEHDLTLAAGRGGRVRHPGAALVRRRRRPRGRVLESVRPAGRARPPASPAETNLIRRRSVRGRVRRSRLGGGIRLALHAGGFAVATGGGIRPGGQHLPGPESREGAGPQGADAFSGGTGCQIARTLSACGPFGPWVVSNSTR